MFVEKAYYFCLVIILNEEKESKIIAIILALVTVAVVQCRSLRENNHVFKLYNTTNPTYGSNREVNFDKEM